MDDIEPVYGVRAWHGRTGERHVISPVVEYQIQPDWIELPGEQGKRQRRQLNTAVCAAFYDTGVAFAPATASEGERLRVRYRYTGYPAEEDCRGCLRGEGSVQSADCYRITISCLSATSGLGVEFSKRLPMDSAVVGRSSLALRCTTAPTTSSSTAASNTN
ncbi:MAG UNVERIFIED_CONTAM: hypothetical protein LVR18_34560 [Planctomycetaceae bacterium]